MTNRRGRRRTASSDRSGRARQQLPSRRRPGFGPWLGRSRARQHRRDHPVEGAGAIGPSTNQRMSRPNCCVSSASARSELAQNCFRRPGEDDFRPDWREIGAAFEATVTPEEYAALQRATQYAHYTPETIIRALWRSRRTAGLYRGARAGTRHGHRPVLRPVARSAARDLPAHRHRI